MELVKGDGPPSNNGHDAVFAGGLAKWVKTDNLDMYTPTFNPSQFNPGTYADSAVPYPSPNPDFADHSSAMHLRGTKGTVYEGKWFTRTPELPS